LDHASRSPANLVIQPRNVVFARGRPTARWWNGGNAVATAFYNSLSLTFPKGEAFFIDSVRHFRNQVPPALQVQIDDFIRQEAAHSREHSHFNRQAEDAGYDLAPMETELDARLAELKGNPPVVNLALTVALEHFTAIIAHVCLKHGSHFKGASADAAKLWKWHAIEEIEHKGVAFDTFLAATQHLSTYKRWKFRSLTMLHISYTFLKARLRAMRQFFQQDGIDGPMTWLRTFSYLLVYPGILRQVFPMWLSYFKPHFHPWQHDDRALAAQHEAQLSLPVLAEDAVVNVA
jgi:predicted metal-dependent hydrolase